MHTHEPCIRWVEKVEEVSVDYEETQVNNKIKFISLKFSERKSDVFFCELLNETH